MAQQIGELIEWNDARGFGFVRDAAGGRVFLHVSEIAPMANRPRMGDRVGYQLAKGRDGRPSAVRARILGANPVNARSPMRGAPAQLGPRRSVVPAILVCCIAGLLLLGLAIGRVPLWLAGIYAVMSLISFGTYGRDKALAQADEWRISEASLHGLDLCCGIAGGLIGQQVFRHKTSKSGFVLVTTIIAVLHVLALAALCAMPIG